MYSFSQVQLVLMKNLAFIRAMDVRLFHAFPDFVKSLREQSRLSQRDFAKKLKVSSGYVGQWEMGVSQPADEMLEKLCAEFKIKDVEYVKRLAFAQRSPAWVRESIVHYRREGDGPQVLSDVERRILESVRRLESKDQERLVDRVAGWVDALTSHH